MSQSHFYMCNQHQSNKKNISTPTPRHSKVHTTSHKHATMDEACSKALQHVHNGTDTENQWRRAVQCFRTMDELRVALAWQRLSAPLQTRVTLMSTPQQTRITLSQYKMLFKCALRAAERESEKERVVLEFPVNENPSYQSKQRPETLEVTNTEEIDSTKATYKDMVQELVNKIADHNEESDQSNNEMKKNDDRKDTRKSAAEAQYLDIIQESATEIYNLDQENRKLHDLNRELTREIFALKQEIMRRDNSDNTSQDRI